MASRGSWWILKWTCFSGWSLGEHGEWAKYSNFDVATRVPLLVYSPGVTAPPPWPGERIFTFVDVFQSPTPFKPGESNPLPLGCLDSGGFREGLCFYGMILIFRLFDPHHGGAGGRLPHRGVRCRAPPPPPLPVTVVQDQAVYRGFESDAPPGPEREHREPRGVRLQPVPTPGRRHQAGLRPTGAGTHQGHGLLTAL